jgi:hypothetical protein
MSANSDARGKKSLSMNECFKDLERSACAGNEGCEDDVGKLVEPKQYELLHGPKGRYLVGVGSLGQAGTRNHELDIATVCEGSRNLPNFVDRLKVASKAASDEKTDGRAFGACLFKGVQLRTVLS